jgi:ribonuclease P protein subunit RPR2
LKDKSKKPSTKLIARERIAILFAQARRVYAESPELANRYVELARRISMRQRCRIDREFRRQFCHHCYAYLVPGRNMRVRVHRGNVVVTCHECNRRTRYRIERTHDREE